AHNGVPVPFTGAPPGAAPPVIAASADRAVTPAAVSGTGGPARLITAEAAAGQAAAAGTDTGAFTIRGARGLSTPTWEAEAIFGNGGAPPVAAADALAGTPLIPVPASAITAAVAPITRAASLLPAKLIITGTSQRSR
ncbi:MAG TPA: hypothetical protein VF482_11450, partial [Trebonia sp.]